MSLATGATDDNDGMQPRRKFDIDFFGNAVKKWPSNSVGHKKKNAAWHLDENATQRVGLDC
jgi:hypothetical protein